MTKLPVISRLEEHIEQVVSAHAEVDRATAEERFKRLEAKIADAHEEYLTIKQILERYTICERTAYTIARRYGRKRGNTWEVSTKYLPYSKLRRR